MLPYLKGRFANPSSAHRLGRVARAGLDRAREQVAALVQVHPTEVIFTSGGTEANNLALAGVLAAEPRPGRLLVSAIEHPSVLEPARRWTRQGWQLDYLPVDGQGRAKLDTLPADVRLISLMLANNETGVIQPVAELAEAARAQGCILHTDAVQAAGKIPVSFAATGARLMSLSAHKLYGPKGVGALIVDKALDLLPAQLGGGQERGRRSGTENLPGIVGFGMAAELALAGMEQQARTQLELRRRLEQGLQALPAVTVFGQQAERLPNTVQLSVPGIDGEALLLQLDKAGFAVSSGSACASGKQEPSHVLQAMGVDETTARGAIRISLGKATTATEIDRLLTTLGQLSAWVVKTSGAVAW